MLLFYNVLKFAETLADGALIELKSNPLTAGNDAYNWGFILFFICFFIIVSIISNSNKFLLSMFSGLYHNKDRHNMFYETVTNENLNKFLLSLQTVLLLSIIFYSYTNYEHHSSFTTFPQMLIFVGKCALLLIGFFIFKFLIYSLTGAIFHKKETVLQWNDEFFSLISLNGIFLFFPALIFFYVESAFYICICFFAFYFIINLLFVFYKIYILFFQGKQLLLYFILYLCTQEIIPLYLVYRGLVYLIEQKDIIWMQA
jgi:hypothetical protein